MEGARHERLLGRAAEARVFRYEMIEVTLSRICISIALICSLGIPSVGKSARQCNESISKYVNLEDKAVKKVAAEYPAEPGFRVEGKVTVRIVVNKKGNVVSARAICGHPLLIAPSIKAARRWQFQPQRVDGRTTKNIGVIVFIFEDTNQNEQHS